MSKSQKLYERLDLLEAEFLRLLAVEFEQKSCGGPAEFLKWFVREEWQGGYGLSSGKRYKTPHVTQLCHLRDEILTLRLKLDASVRESPIRLLDEYYQRINDPSAEGCDVAVARDILDQLNSNASSESGDAYLSE